MGDERPSKAEFCDLVPHLTLKNLLLIEYRIFDWKKMITVMNATNKQYRCNICMVKKFGDKIHLHMHDNNHKTKMKMVKQFYLEGYTYPKNHIINQLKVMVTNIRPANNNNKNVKVKNRVNVISITSPNEKNKLKKVPIQTNKNNGCTVFTSENTNLEPLSAEMGEVTMANTKDISNKPLPAKKEKNIVKGNNNSQTVDNKQLPTPNTQGMNFLKNPFSQNEDLTITEEFNATLAKDLAEVIVIDDDDQSLDTEIEGENTALTVGKKKMKMTVVEDLADVIVIDDDDQSLDTEIEGENAVLTADKKKMKTNARKDLPSKSQIVVNTKEIDQLIAEKHNYKPPTLLCTAKKKINTTAEATLIPMPTSPTPTAALVASQEPEAAPPPPVGDTTYNQYLENCLRDTNGRYSSNSRYSSRSKSPSYPNKRLNYGDLSERRKSVSPLRKDDIWQAYRHMVDRKLDEINMLYNGYCKDPKTHPMYNEEWQKFWKRLRQNLYAAGINQRSYDYQSEWMVYFTTRIAKLHNQSIEEAKVECRKRLCLPMANDTLENPNYHINNAFQTTQPISNNKLKLQHNNMTDPKTKECYVESYNCKVVSDLRCMTALKNELGTSGPKSMELMSITLQIEKTSPMEVDRIILTEENCTMIQQQMKKFAKFAASLTAQGKKNFTPEQLEQLLSEHEQTSSISSISNSGSSAAQTGADNTSLSDTLTIIPFSASQRDNVYENQSHSNRTETISSNYSNNNISNALEQRSNVPTIDADQNNNYSRVSNFSRLSSANYNSNVSQNDRRNKVCTKNDNIRSLNSSGVQNKMGIQNSMSTQNAMDVPNAMSVQNAMGVQNTINSTNLTVGENMDMNASQNDTGSMNNNNSIMRNTAQNNNRTDNFNNGSNSADTQVWSAGGSNWSSYSGGNSIFNQQQKQNTGSTQLQTQQWSMSQYQVNRSQSNQPNRLLQFSVNQNQEQNHNNWISKLTSASTSTSSSNRKRGRSPQIREKSNQKSNQGFIDSQRKGQNWKIF